MVSYQPTRNSLSLAQWDRQRVQPASLRCSCGWNFATVKAVHRAGVGPEGALKPSFRVLFNIRISMKEQNIKPHKRSEASIKAMKEQIKILQYLIKQSEAKLK